MDLNILLTAHRHIRTNHTFNIHLYSFRTPVTASSVHYLLTALTQHNQERTQHSQNSQLCISMFIGIMNSIFLQLIRSILRRNLRDVFRNVRRLKKYDPFHYETKPQSWQAWDSPWRYDPHEKTLQRPLQQARAGRSRDNNVAAGEDTATSSRGGQG